MRIKILGKYWNLRFVNFLGSNEFDGEILGKCEDPDSPNRKIYIKRGQKPKDEMDTLLHELLHSLDFLKNSEEFVEQAAEDITSVMWKLGYRRLKGQQLKDFDDGNKS